MSRKSRLVGFLLTGVFIWILAQNVSLEQLADAFAGADYALVGPAAAATFTGYMLRSLRWQRIVQPVAPLRFFRAFSILMMGFAANNLLPARLGEFVRAYLLTRESGVRKTYGMATVFLERVCDGLVLIGLLGGVSILMPLPVWGQEVQLFSTLVFLAAGAGILALLLQEQPTLRLLTVLLRPLPTRLRGPLLRALGAFIGGLQSLKNRRSLLLVIFLSVSIWLLETTSYLLITRAFGVWLPLEQQLLAAVFLLVMVNLGIMLPSAPGYVGTFQFFAVTALSVFAVPKETALAIAISSHLMQYLLVTGIGLALFARAHLSLSSLQKDSDEVVRGDEEAADVDSTSASIERTTITETTTIMEIARVRVNPQSTPGKWRQL